MLVRKRVTISQGVYGAVLVIALAAVQVLFSSDIAQAQDDFVLIGGTGGTGPNDGGTAAGGGTDSKFDDDSTSPSDDPSIGKGQNSEDSGTTTAAAYVGPPTTPDLDPLSGNAPFDKIIITGGLGGGGGSAGSTGNGAGGGGGVAFIGTGFLDITADITAASLAITGGKGGQGGAGQTGGSNAGGDGGAGGALLIGDATDRKTLTVTGEAGETTVISGGSGGAGGLDNDAGGGEGGAGGAVELQLSGLVVQAGDLTLQSGAAGTAAGTARGDDGAGGSITVEIEGKAGTTPTATTEGILSANSGTLTIEAVNALANVDVTGGAGTGTAGRDGIIRGEGIVIKVSAGNIGEVQVDAIGGGGDTAGGTGWIDAQGGILAISSTGDSTTGTNADITVQITGASPTAGSAGTAKITATGGLDLSSSGDTAYYGGDVSVTLTGGTSTAATAVAGGGTIVDLRDSTDEARGNFDVSVAQKGGSVSFAATGGTGSATGNGGEATIYAKDISVTTHDETTFAPGSVASIGLTGGNAAATGSGAGGLSKIDATGTINVTAGRTTAELIVTGGSGGTSVTDSDRGKADVTSVGVNVTAKHADATLTVAGGATGSAAGGGASLASSGDVTVQANVTGGGTGQAFLNVTGTAAGGGDNAGGAATLTVSNNKKLTVAGTTANATVEVEAGAGAGDSGGSLAVVNASDVEINAAEGIASLSLTGGSAGSGGTEVGGNAEFHGQNLTIQTVNENVGQALVTLTSGAGGGSSSDGNAVVDLSGNLTVKAADGSKTSAAGSDGNAGITAVVNTGGTTDGARILSVGGDINQTSGNAKNSKFGADSSIVFDDVDVAGKLNVSTGTDISATILGGVSTFMALNSLSAPVIDLTQGGATKLDFYAEELIVDQDTLITADKTYASAIGSVTNPVTASNFGVYLARATLSKNSELAIANKNGDLTIDRISLYREKGKIALEDPDKLNLGTLSAVESTLTFVLPEGFDDGSTFIKATDADFQDSTIVVSGYLDDLDTTDEVTLVDTVNPIVNEPDDVVIDPYASGLLEYRILPEFDVRGIRFLVTGRSAKPVAKALSEGQAASQAFVNRGSDFVAGEGISSAVFAAADAGFSFFSAVSYGHERYETGSHVDVGGVSILLGGAYGTDVSVGRLTFGAFFELGDGTYDSYNDFANYGTVNGSGDTEYVGGGLLARLDLAGSSTGHTYVEASGRVGRVSADFASADLPADYRYDLSATYYGFHVGVGRVFNITDSTTFDLYGKWLFTHQGGKNATIAGENVHFDDISSHRLRGGFRITTEVNEWFKPYFGAAYEHELDGKAEASVRGYAIDVPELKGGTGIGEIGVSFAAVDRLTVDLSVQGYVGQRQGVSGGLRLTYNF